MNEFFIKKTDSDSLISISFLKMLGSSGFGFLRRSLFSAVRYGGKQPPMVGLGLGLRWMDNESCCIRPSVAFFCAEPSSSNHQEKRFNVAGGGGVGGGGGGGGEKGVGDESISFAEAKKLMRLVNVEALKRKLGMEEEEVILYTDLLKACESMGVARSSAEAASFARVLDEAGVILLFRDKVYLHPDKVVDLVRRAVPLALSPEDDPRRGELKKLQQEKQEIDMLAHKQVRRILWSGLAFSVTQVGLFFRLTFWEFSWDVMEPIAFFTTTTGLVIGYAYFLFTSRDPTYQDLMKRLFISRQRNLYKKQKFDFDRYIELQRHCKSPLDTTTSGTIKTKLELDPEDIIHRDQPRTL